MRPASGTGQEIAPLPSRAEVKAVTHIRSTLLMSSQTTLRETGLYDRYRLLLPAYMHDQILQLSAPTWLPLSLGIAHYSACDQLGLSDKEAVAMATRLAMNRRGSFLGIALNLACGAGATPWTIAKQIPKMWARAFMGGAIGGTKLGPKELRLEIAGWPLADISWTRNAVNGLVLGVLKLTCREAYVRTLPSERPAEAAYQISWV
jgi:hypothetical protein